MDELWNEVKDGFAWLWGLVQGDFNKNPTTSQIITNMVITAIPVVDQVADVRDIVANIKLLVWDKKYNELAPWLALFFTLIGLVPTFGSLLKGVLKLVWKGAKLDEILKVFNYFMKGNGVKWLKELANGKLYEYTSVAKHYAHAVFQSFIDNFNKIKNQIPKWMVFAHNALQELLDTLKYVKSMINRQFDTITKQLCEKIKKIIRSSSDDGVDVGARQTARRQQSARIGERRISDDLYEELRGQTPNNNIRNMVNRNQPTPPFPDPVLEGFTVTQRLEADHIVSMDRIARMEGFDRLTREQQLNILNDPQNFIGLSRSANASKGSKTFEEWTHHVRTGTPVNPEFRRAMIARERELEIVLQQQIDDYVSLNR